MNSVMIVAAEASSGLFAQRLLEHWQLQKKEIKFFGVGTKEMEDLGFERFGKAEEMAVVGATEAIEAYSRLKIVFNKLIDEAQVRRPKVVILMDYPEFNLMLAKKLHALGIPCVYYITPQVWAWRKGRVQTIKKYCTKVFVVFPFEEEFFRSKGVPVEFVGHPILDELKDKYFSEEYHKIHRSRCGIASDQMVLGIMPGSRKGEIQQHFKLQLSVAKRLYKEFPHLKVLIMTAPTVTKEYLQEFMDDVDFPVMLVKDEPFEMIELADIVLAASGTATLMVGLLGKPMVVMYKVKFLTGILARLLVRGVNFFGIVNLIFDKEVVPERFQGDASEEELYKLMKRYIVDSSYRESVVEELKKLHHVLGEKGATRRVTKSLEGFLQ